MASCCLRSHRRRSFGTQLMVMLSYTAPPPLPSLLLSLSCLCPTCNLLFYTFSGSSFPSRCHLTPSARLHIPRTRSPPRHRLQPFLTLLKHSQAPVLFSANAPRSHPPSCRASAQHPQHRPLSTTGPFSPQPPSAADERSRQARSMTCARECRCGGA